MKKVSIITLGCKVNQYESASFRSSFEAAGCSIVSADEHPDIVVINTCTVTGKAGAQSRQFIRRSARENRKAKIVITGCHAQMAANELIEMEELADTPVCIVGNGNKHLLVKTALNESKTDLAMLMGKISQKKEICDLPISHFGDRTRAFLRVQDGCNSFCTYCIVPYTRGPSRSLPIGRILDQAHSLASSGYKEIVVTGIHVGLYGQDLQEDHDIVSLMKNLCDSTPNIRYRLSSIEPLEISNRLLDAMTDYHNFMPHLHIPLQSGDDEILALMNRRYKRETFRDIISLCRKKQPDAAIGIDVMVGFPGESDRHFDNCLNFLQEIDCTYLHVFPYSKRPGTLASTSDNQIEKVIKAERVEILRQLGNEKKKTFYKRQLESSRDVLIESKRDQNNNLKGLTDNYIPVCLPGEDDLINCIVPVRLKTLDELVVSGEMIRRSI